MVMTVVALTPERQGLFLDLFDGEGFADNPDWSGCYCLAYHFDHDNGDWDAASAADNRAAACTRIADGGMQGWLALDDGRAVGWINAARKDSYWYMRRPGTPGGAGETTGMVTCFLVAPSARGKGVARALLNAAVSGFRAEGLHRVEAKAAKEPDGDAENFHGPLALYREAGFEVVGDFSASQHLLQMAL